MRLLIKNWTIFNEFLKLGNLLLAESNPNKQIDIIQETFDSLYNKLDDSHTLLQYGMRDTLKFYKAQFQIYREVIKGK